MSDNSRDTVATSACFVGVQQQTAQSPASASQSEGKLRGLQGKQLAVIVESRRETLVFRGTGIYRQFGFGNDLRIEVHDDDSAPVTGMVFTIREEEWEGEVVPDHEHGCDFQIRVKL